MDLIGYSTQYFMWYSVYSLDIQRCLVISPSCPCLLALKPSFPLPAVLIAMCTMDMTGNTHKIHHKYTACTPVQSKKYVQKRCPSLLSPHMPTLCHNWHQKGGRWSLKAYRKMTKSVAKSIDVFELTIALQDLCR